MPQQLPLPADDSALHLPVLGQVAAGLPIGADIGSEQVVLMDRALFSPAPDYLLKVKGDSMRDEGMDSWQTSIARLGPMCTTVSW